MKLKYRKSIEIYFVLYLAALIFLLPSPEDDNKKPDERNSKVFQIPFTIQPEKTTLNCRLLLDSSGIKIVSMDSVNTVIYFGEVENVDFEFTIEDPLLRQKLLLKDEEDTTNPYFRFVENKKSQSALFFWTPPIYERANKTYNVIVTASASLKDDNKDGANDGNISNRTIKAQTKFSLNMIYVNADLAVNNNLLLQNGSDSLRRLNIQNQPFIGFQPTGEIDIKSEQSLIRAVAFHKWTNFINIYGGTFTKDINKYNVQAINERGDNGGTAAIVKEEPNRIILSGTAPSYGKMKVQFSSISRFKRDTVDFLVVTLPINEPKFDRTMYPEKIYTIDPQIPLMYGQDIKTMIRDGNNIRVQSEQGNKFQFTPDISDAGKTFTLESYIDDNLYGQKYQIRILNYPGPLIKDIQYIRNGEVKIITHSFGFHNRKENISELEVEGNVIVRELRGTIPESPDNITFVQIFRCTPRNQSQPFAFKVYALDSRGKKSAQRSYEE
ncbi:MAG: hypothetical protein M1419_04395 [Bacteroidetes bacterium]|nr:hypothetical protein [Bacteroidota bacterium]